MPLLIYLHDGARPGVSAMYKPPSELTYSFFPPGGNASSCISLCVFSLLTHCSTRCHYNKSGKRNFLPYNKRSIYHWDQSQARCAMQDFLFHGLPRKKNSLHHG